MGGVRVEGLGERREVLRGVVHARARRAVDVVQVRQRAVKAPHQRPGREGPRSTVDAVEARAALDEGLRAPHLVALRRRPLDPQRAVVGAQQPRRRDALRREVRGDGLDVVVHQRAEHRVQPLQLAATPVALDEERVVDEAVAEGRRGAAGDAVPAREELFRRGGQGIRAGALKSRVMTPVPPEGTSPSPSCSLTVCESCVNAMPCAAKWPACTLV